LGAPCARRIVLHTLDGPEAQPPPPASLEDDERASEPDNQQPEAEQPEEQQPEADPFCGEPASSPRHAGRTESGYVGSKRARGIGIRVHNVKWSPIGAEVEAISQDGPAARGGLRVNDIIVAVNGVACLSHMHTCQLLRDSFDPIEVIAWSPRGLPAAPPAEGSSADNGPECVDLS